MLNVLVPIANLVKKAYLFLAKEKCSRYAVNWCVSPSLNDVLVG